MMRIRHRCTPSIAANVRPQQPPHLDPLVSRVKGKELGPIRAEGDVVGPRPLPRVCTPEKARAEGGCVTPPCQRHGRSRQTAGCALTEDEVTRLAVTGRLRQRLWWWGGATDSVHKLVQPWSSRRAHAALPGPWVPFPNTARTVPFSCSFCMRLLFSSAGKFAGPGLAAGGWRALASGHVPIACPALRLGPQHEAAAQLGASSKLSGLAHRLAWH